MGRLAMPIAAACCAAAWAPTAAGAAAPLKATSPVSDQVPKFQQAVSDRSCDEILPLFTTLSLRPAGTSPEAPAQPGECDRLSKTFFDDWSGFQLNATRDFGTAALVTGQKDGVKEQVWNLDSDGTYRFAFGLQADGDDTTHALIAKKNAIRSARAYVVAIRKHDCKALNKLTLPGAPTRQGTSGNKSYCKAVFAGHFQKWLRKTPKAVPVFEGGTGGIAFFYVKTKHELTTIAMGKRADFTNRYGALTYTFNKGKI